MAKIPGDDLLQIRHLPEAPTLIVLFGQLAHRHQHIHRADVTFGPEYLVGGRFDLLSEFGSVHGREKSSNAEPEPINNLAYDSRQTSCCLLLVIPCRTLGTRFCLLIVSRLTHLTLYCRHRNPRSG